LTWYQCCQLDDSEVQPRTLVFIPRLQFQLIPMTHVYAQETRLAQETM